MLAYIEEHPTEPMNKTARRFSVSDSTICNLRHELGLPSKDIPRTVYNAEQRAAFVDAARRLMAESGGQRKVADVAEELGVHCNTLSTWLTQDTREQQAAAAQRRLQSFDMPSVWSPPVLAVERERRAPHQVLPAVHSW